MNLLSNRHTRLAETRFCQPAVVVTSLAAVEWLYNENPKAAEDCVALAGFSVGEITALIFSGALTFDDGIHLVKIRGEAMQYCSEAVPSGMMSVFYGASANLGLATEVARKWIQEKQGIENPVCNVANFLYAGAKVIAGHNEVNERALRTTSEPPMKCVVRLPLLHLVVHLAPPSRDSDEHVFARDGVPPEPAHPFAVFDGEVVQVGDDFQKQWPQVRVSKELSDSNVRLFRLVHFLSFDIGMQR